MAFVLSFYSDFPCGAAYRAIRSPRTNSSSDLKRVQRSDSASSLDSISSSSQQLTAKPSDNNNQAASATTNLHATAALSTTEQDLAKRAQRRVIDHKRSELEKKHELEKVRAKKLESDKLKKERSNQLKLRRRAEIYALNAIMKQVQQDKISKFLAAAQQQQQLKSDTTNPSQTASGSPTAAAVFPVHVMQSIGV